MAHTTCDRYQILWEQSLLAMRPALITSSPKLYPIQALVRQQHPQLNHLGDSQCYMSSRAVLIEGKVIEHRIGRSQGFTEVGQQHFGVDTVSHGE
ncbi:hypothetical protein D3C84_1152650 [compost metagenome]